MVFFLLISLIKNYHKIFISIENNMYNIEYYKIFATTPATLSKIMKELKLDKPKLSCQYIF